MSSEDAADVTSAPNETTYTDPSGAIFSMYITRALKFDRENVENWKGGADGILIFVRFSVALTMITVYTHEPSPFSDWSFFVFGGIVNCH